MLNEILYKIKKYIPKNLFTFFQPTYHYLLALTGAIIYRFPSRKIFVIQITGTKGKTSTAELVNAVLEEAGFKTALLGTLRFKIGIPDIIITKPIHIHLELVAIQIDIRDERLVVVYKIPSISQPFESSQSCILFKTSQVYQYFIPTKLFFLRKIPLLFS